MYMMANLAIGGLAGNPDPSLVTQFKIDHKLSELVHAGDKVKFSVRDGGDPKTSTEKTITKIEVD